MAEPIAVMVMAYGGPNSLEEIEPYLMDVRGGRPLSETALHEVIGRYEQIGGRSPILEHTTEQAEALQQALDRQAGEFKVIVGMRHWHPYIHETLQGIMEEGMDFLVGIVMAPHNSRMSIGAYYKRLHEAVEAHPKTIEIAEIRSWNTDPGYLKAVEARIRQGLDRFDEEIRDDVHLIFTAHSLPERILEWEDPYPRELRGTFEALKARFPDQTSSFAYQSAAMTPEPWLGPDAGDFMLELIEQGVRSFLVVPIGFVSEHVEILYDIDIDFRGKVEMAGGRLERIEMPGADPVMMDSLADRVREKATKRGWL